MSKRYGLILSGQNEKTAPTFMASRNVFGDDSDSDGDAGLKKPIPPSLPSDKIKKQVKLAQEKALNEDPTVYQYDEVYEKMEQKKKEEKSVAKVEKRPKYIEKLMDSASKRKRENERRLERQVQKEREKEGNEFADKESFVTNAYKQKLEELRAEDEKEKREEYLESIGDVTKQQDLGGFYRHFYEQKLGTQGKQKDTKVSQNEPSEVENKEQASLQKHPNKPESEKMSPASLQRKIRNYRKRKMSSEMQDHQTARELSEGEIVSEEEIENVPTLEDIRATRNTNKGNAVPSIDEDSDISLDSSDSESEVKNKKSKKEKSDEDKHANIYQGKCKESTKKHKMKEGTNNPGIEQEVTQEFKIPTSKENVGKGSNKSVPKVNESDEAKSPPQEKVNIWEKRTVGVVFEEALRRYYERKAARSQ